MNEMSLFVVFCDDVRHEIGNKYSLIGCYSEQMYVGSFPAALPKLCVHTTLSIPAGVALSHVTMKMKNGAQEIATYALEINDETFSQPVSSSSSDARVLTGAFTLSPLSLEKETYLEVLAEVGGEVVVGGKLDVLEVPSQELG